MARLRLGGIKAFEKRAYLTSLCRRGGDVLRDICARLAADEINLSLLTHIANADNETHKSITSACTGNAEGFAGYILWKESQGECDVGKLLSDVSIISIFPHDQRVDVIGSLIGVLAGQGIIPHGFASSPSAITTVVPSSAFEDVIYSLFQAFEFPTYASPLDWHAAYRGQEELLHEIICSYEEEIIKVYNVTQLDGLDLWDLHLPFRRLGDLGALMLEWHQMQLRMPFLVSKASPDEISMTFAFCLAAGRRREAERVFDRYLPGPQPRSRGPVSVLFLHGPHFGDRYGIASALVKSLGNAGIIPLAVSCAVSSISVVVAEEDSKQIIKALDPRFRIPGKKL